MHGNTSAHSNLAGLKILIVETDLRFAQQIGLLLQARAAEYLVLDTLAQARRHFSHYHPDIAVCSLDFSDGDSLELLKEWKEEAPSLPVIAVSNEKTLESVMLAMRSGAFDYLQKPIDDSHILMSLKRSSEISMLRAKVSRMQGRERAKVSQTIVGSSKLTRSMVSSLRKVARSKCDSCIIYGESGVGKELAAHLIHDFSDRAKEPFIEINAASIPDTLLESELFGHERGAYTDAKDKKVGLLEIAGSGTVFLDEIGELAMSLQAKLLRVLESRRFKRLGGVRDIELKARIVAATNRNLMQSVVDGNFRKDLYYRLNVIPIHVPCLSERPGDIEDIANFFLDSLSADLEVQRPSIPEETIEFLQHHSWPGNVRELKNVLYRSLVMYGPEVLLPKHIELEELPEISFPRSGNLRATHENPKIETSDSPAMLSNEAVFTLPKEGVLLDDVEESLIRQALDRAKFNQTKAAHLLGITRHALRYRLEKYGLADKH
ncbi:MAG: sigma-54 dependent transcriptional regulator [Bdellovibrionota bacterium]